MPIDPSSDDDNAWWNNPGPLRLTIHPQAPPRPPSNAPLIPGASYDDWATRNDPLGATSYPDDWYVPANTGNGASNSDDWVHPDDWFVPTSMAPPQPSIRNLRPAPPDPFAAYWASIPASRVGALAWHPPIFPDALGQFSIPAPAPLTAPPEAANGILGGIAKMLAASTDAPSVLGAIGQLPSPAPEPTNNPRGLFSDDPSIRTGGLFPYSFGSAPSLASPFQRGFLPANGHARPMPGTPGAPATLGLPASNSPLPPPAQSQTSPAASVSSFDPLNGPPVSSPADMAAPAAPKRSVLFTHPPASWDPATLDRAQANLDQTDPSLAVSGLPISKSGAPFIPPPLPQFSITPEQAFDVAHLVSPNIADYLTKPLPPLQPFPATPGKIPSTDNPYAGPAALEAATWLLPFPERGIVGPLERVANVAETNAAEAASRRIAAALQAALASGSLTREQAAILLQRANAAGEEGTAVPEAAISAWLPEYDGKTTYGVLITNEGNVVPLQSGPPQSFQNYVPSRHVEGKGAIWIRENGSSGGVLYHNNTDGTCGFCNSQVETLLPEKVPLDIVPPADAIGKNSWARSLPTPYLGNSTVPKSPPIQRQYEMFGKRP